MAHIKIEGVSGLDGEYPFDFSYFTNREFHMIKQIANVRGAELEEAFAAGDNDLTVAIAMIALRRAGKEPHVDVLWDAPLGKITFEVDEEPQVADAGPPSVAPPEQRQNGSVSGVSEPSGAPSSETGVQPERIPISTGPLG